MSKNQKPLSGTPLLFDNVERDYVLPANAGESLYSFYNRSSLEGFARVRTMLQRWIERLPDDQPKKFVSKMRHKGRGSPKENQQFNSAFVELFVHEFLRGTTDAHVEVEPSINGLTPDFRVTETLSDGTDVEYVVEVTDMNLEKVPHPSTDWNERYVIDALDEIDSPDYFLHMETRGTLDRTPRKRDIQRPFQELIEATDYEEALVLTRIPGNMLDVMPTKTIQLGDWTLTGSLMPVSPGHRPKIGRFVGGYPSQDATIPTLSTPRNKLVEKARVYRDINNLIIALRFSHWEIPMDQLLLGLPDVETSPYGQSGVARAIPQGQSDYDSAGFWLDKTSLRHENVIGVVAFHTLHPHCVDKSTAVFYPNPYVPKPLPAWATSITHADYSDCRLNIVQGLPPCAYATDYEVVERPFG